MEMLFQANKSIYGLKLRLKYLFRLLRFSIPENKENLVSGPLGDNQIKNYLYI
jgi:hypothetical protein